MCLPQLLPKDNLRNRFTSVYYNYTKKGGTVVFLCCRSPLTAVKQKIFT